MIFTGGKGYALVVKCFNSLLRSTVEVYHGADINKAVRFQLSFEIYAKGVVKALKAREALKVSTLF